MPIQNITDLLHGCSAATKLGLAEWNKIVVLQLKKSSTAARLRQAAVVFTQLKRQKSLSPEAELSAEKRRVHPDLQHTFPTIISQETTTRFLSLLTLKQQFTL